MKILKYKFNPNKRGVFRVSVVENPAVGEGDLVLMSAQEIKGVFYAPVMIPDLKIQRIDEATGERYLVYYDAETVEQLANNYFKQCGNMGTNLNHELDNADGVYPVESWIVKDPANDKSNALGMPTQKEGTWIMGYKCESPEILEKIKNNLLQGLSIEGQLDSEEEVNVKFNKSFMKKTPLEFAKHLANVIMAAATNEEKKPTAEVEGTPEEEATETPAEEKVEDPTGDESENVDVVDSNEDAATETPEQASSELETAKATIAELEKKNSDLEAELATYKNDAVLMSEQLEEVQKSFESYKSVKMSSQKLGDAPRAIVQKSYEEMSNVEKAMYNRGRL